MRTARLNLLVAVMAGIGVATTVPAETAFGQDRSIVDQIDIPYEVFTLDNGLTTIVHTDHSAPTVFVGVWYGVGSKDEPAGKSGFAHLFEHLMFQGTANREGEYFAPFTKAGAIGINGTTNPDRTNYFATVPTGALDMALWMESDRMTYLLGAVDQAALDEQREVVKNEKRQGENQPYASMREPLLEGRYPIGHPYRHTTIGSMEDLDAASVEDVHDWFEKYYGASNVTLVLAGDIDLETAKTKVAKYFGEAPTGVPLVKQVEWVPTIAENRLEMMYDKVPQAVISRNWVLPPITHRDTTVMSLAYETLAGNKNSPLRKKLVDELGWATNIAGGASGQILAGTFRLHISLKPGVAPEDVRRVVDETVAAYLADGPDRGILENAKLATNMRAITAMEHRSIVGSVLADGQLRAGDPGHYKKELGWLNAATAAEVRSVAEEWLTRGYYELTVLPFPPLTSAEPTVDRSKVPPVGDVSDFSFPEIETRVLSNGAKLVFAKHGSLPLVDVGIEFATGRNADTDGKVGVAGAVFDLLDSGTREYSASELATEMDEIAMRPGIRAGREASFINYTILTPHFAESLKLAAEMLQNPSFPAEELEKERSKWLVTIAGRETNPARTAPDYFDRAVYDPAGPLGKIRTKESVSSLSRDDLVAFHAREIAPDNMTIYLVGDVALDDAEAALEKAFGKWKAKSASQLRGVGKAQDAAPRVILVNKPDAVQSTIVAGLSLPGFDAEAATTLDTMNRIFGGGFEGRINMNLREDKGWSYGMRSRLRTNPSGHQTLAVSGSVQTDKTTESMAEIMKEYAEFVSSRPATAAELDRVVQNRTRSLAGNFSTGFTFLASMSRSARFGLPLDHAESAASRIRAVTLDQVNAAAKRLIDPGKLTWVVVGDLAKIEEGVRALDYGAVEVWDAYGNRIR